MDHLDYDDTDKDLTIVIKSEDDTVFCESKVNSVLLKMLSPWWKTKLTSSGFMDWVHSSSCTITHESPRVAEFALNAARLRIKQSDLVSEADLGFTLQLWQLADMWQFGYLCGLCQGALQELLTGQDADTLKSFVTAALEHSDAILESVLVPFFIDHPKERSQAVYLAFDDTPMLRLAEVAPIAGFQTVSQNFKDRLASYVETCDDTVMVQYLQNNPEARSTALYRKQSFERCMLLFAAAPLPFVQDMVELTLKSSWAKEQKQLAMSAIDFDRVTSRDERYLSLHHKELPQEVYIYRALWKCTQRKVATPAFSIATSPPWAVAYTQTYYGEDKAANAGPVKFAMQSVRQSVFFCNSPAYGIINERRIVRPGMPFSFQSGDWIVVYEAPSAFISRSIN